METYAMVHITRKFVANVLLWDSNSAETRAPDEYEMVAVAGRFCGPGMLYENGEFVPVPGMAALESPVEPSAA